MLQDLLHLSSARRALSHFGLSPKPTKFTPFIHLHLLFLLCDILHLYLPETFGSWFRCVLPRQNQHRKDYHNIELWSILPFSADYCCYCQLSYFLLFYSKRQPSYLSRCGEGGRQELGISPATLPLAYHTKFEASKRGVGLSLFSKYPSPQVPRPPYLGLNFNLQHEIWEFVKLLCCCTEDVVDGNFSWKGYE